MKNSSTEILRNAKRIAVVRTDRLGDMVLTLPMLKCLKELYPSAELSLIASTYVSQLIENQRCIDKIYYIDRFTNGIRDIFRITNFDAVFFPRPRFNECYAAFKSGVKLRIGSAYRYYSILFNHKVKDHRKTAEFHEAEYNVRMVESVSGQQLQTELVPPFISDKISNDVDNLLESLEIPDMKLIIIHPGSGGSARDIPVEYFALIAEFFMNKEDYQVIVTGTEFESENCEFISQKVPGVINLSGRLNLEMLIGLISKSHSLISNSTGVIHVASSLGKKVVGFYPNSPHISSKRWGPYTKDALIFTPPYSKDKKLIDEMTRIDIGEVIESLERYY